MQVSFSFLVPPCVGDPCDDSLGVIYIWACSGFSDSRCPASDAAFCCWFVILCKPHNPQVVLAAHSAAEKLVPEKHLKYLQTGLNRNLECWGSKWGMRPPVGHSQFSSNRWLVVGVVARWDFLKEADSLTTGSLSVCASWELPIL